MKIQNRCALLENGATNINQIITGDARILSQAIPDESIDLIFCDPPYIREHIPLYGWLSEEASRVLKPGSLLLAYTGTYWKYEVMQSLGKYLDYFWDFITIHRTSRTVVWQRHVIAGYKSILAFSKGTPIKDSYNMLDLWVGSGKDKQYHVWGQDESTARYYIQCLSGPDAVIWDPFCGGGTVPVICKQLGRNFIAFEIDPLTADIARKRLEVTQPLLMPEEATQLELAESGVLA